MSIKFSMLDERNLEIFPLIYIIHTLLIPTLQWKLKWYLLSIVTVMLQKQLQNHRDIQGFITHIPGVIG